MFCALLGEDFSFINAKSEKMILKVAIYNFG